MSFTERAGEFLNRAKEALQDPEERRMLSHLKGAIKAFEEGDLVTEQRHRDAIVGINDEHSPSARPGTQPGKSPP